MAKKAPDGSGSESPRGRRGKRPIWMAAIAALVTFVAIYGLWSRQDSQSESADPAAELGGLFQLSQGQGTPLVSVGRTQGLDRPCTAWLLDTGAPEQASAYAVTAGRCVGIEDTATVLTEQDLTGATVEFNAFARLTSAAPLELVEVPLDGVVWASMRGTDLAILRLGATYGDLTGRGLIPISTLPGPTGDGELLVASVPMAGIPADQQFLRGNRCSSDRSADVIDGDFFFADFWVSDCGGVRAGSEGAPAFNQPGQAVGMVVTSTIGSDQEHPCVAGLPCEVEDGSAKVEQNATYLAGLGALAECFVDGAFRLGEECPLEDPEGVVRATAQSRVAEPGTTVRVRVRGSGADEAKVVAGPAGELSCSDPEAWRAARRQSEESVEVTDPGAVVTLPEADGFTLVCVGSAEQGTPIVLESDGTPPNPDRIELRQEDAEGGVLVAPVAAPPDLAAFRWTSGPVGSLDCATAEGFVEYEGTPSFIQAADLPSTVCVVAIDEAGNEAAPRAIEVK